MTSDEGRGRTDAVVPDTPHLVVAAVPEPRPELLARVLAGLRDLPDAPAPRERPVGSQHAAADVVRAALPRRQG